MSLELYIHTRYRNTMYAQVYCTSISGNILHGHPHLYSHHQKSCLLFIPVTRMYTHEHPRRVYSYSVRSEIVHIHHYTLFVSPVNMYTYTHHIYTSLVYTNIVHTCQYTHKKYTDFVHSEHADIIMYTHALYIRQVYCILQTAVNPHRSQCTSTPYATIYTVYTNHVYIQTMYTPPFRVRPEHVYTPYHERTYISTTYTHHVHP